MKKISEDQYIQSMTNILKQKLQNDYAPGNTKRDAHTKSLGLLKAQFKVCEDLPVDLRVGLFKEPTTYAALIRFSNAMNKVQKDSKKDIRGFAIKLIGVKGQKYLNDEKQTQDFLLISTKTMPFGTVELFHQALYYTIKVNPIVFVLKMIAKGHAKKLKQTLMARKHQTSPLDISYYSTTPYQFGNRVVKYCIVPTSTYRSELPSKLTANYLTENIEQHLSEQDATFDFMIQFQKEGMPIEDAAIEWDEKQSPFIKVGEIIIRRQYFDTFKRNKIAENLSFAPAHCLVEHKPIGGINRARTKIYKTLSAFRHARNHKKPLEPTILDFDTLR